MPTVDSRTEPIRRAVGSGEFRKALALWQEHARQLRQENTERQRVEGETRANARTGGVVPRHRIVRASHAQARLNRIAIAPLRSSSSQPVPDLGKGLKRLACPGMIPVHGPRIVSPVELQFVAQGFRQAVQIGE